MGASDTIRSAGGPRREIMHSIKELQGAHVVYEFDCWDRVVLKVRLPRLFTEGGVSNFLRFVLGCKTPDVRNFVGFRNEFIEQIEGTAENEGIEIHRFTKDETNGAKEKLARAALDELQNAGESVEDRIVFIGKAQEKTFLYTSSWSNGYCSVSRGNLMVNWYYVYIYDGDFGLVSLKICSYAPFQMKFYFNGHEYVKRQLAKKGIGFEALANGLLSCEDPKAANQIVKSLTASRINRVIDKWRKAVPNPLTDINVAFGERVLISIDQAEIAKTQIWDKAARGREFIELSMKEDLDLGRPDKSGLIFNKQHRRNGKQKKFRSLIMTYGVIAVFTIYSLRNKLKQYFKEGRGLRTEFTANNTRDLGIGNTLTQENWNSLWATGHECIDRTLRIKKLSHDPTIGREAVSKLESPLEVKGRRVSGMPRGKERTQALLSALVTVSMNLGRFQNRDLRSLMAPLLGKDKSEITQGQMTYDLRRLRGHGIIEKIKGTNKYKATEEGLRLAVWLTRTEKRLNGEALSGLIVDERHPPSDPRIKRMRDTIQKLDKELDAYLKEEQIAA